MTTDPQASSQNASALGRALEAVEGAVGTAVQDLAKLVAVDTSFPPGLGYAALATCLEPMLEPLGFVSRRVTVPNALWFVPGGPARGERINLIATKPTGKPVCSLYFHADTVPPSPGWTGDPFCLRRDGDRLYGLGACDMKGTMAAALVALRAAAEHDVELAYDPALLFCTDEEGGLYPGIRYLAEQGLIEGHVLNFNGTAAPRIWAGCFGTINFLVKLRGASTHSAEGNRSGHGINAIEGAIPLFAAVSRLQQRIRTRTSSLPAPPGATAPLAAQLSIAAAHGGTAGGQVPAEFEILLSRRYAPEESFDVAREEIEATVRAATAGSRLGVEILLVGHLAPTTDPTGPHWPRWQRALSRCFGYRPEEFRSWGAVSSSDFGFVQQAGICEALLGGLGRPERNLHGPGEHTTLSDITALAQSVLAYLAAEFEPDLIPLAERSFSGEA